MTDAPHHEPAPIGWADFCVRCPGCGELLATHDDWENDTPQSWTPKPEHQFIQCEPCGMLLEAPTIQLRLTYGPVPATSTSADVAEALRQADREIELIWLKITPTPPALVAAIREHRRWLIRLALALETGERR